MIDLTNFLRIVIDIIYQNFMWNNSINNSFFSVPNVTILDGFGRLDRSHFYKVGSSLEVVCQVNYAKRKKLA